MVRIGKALQVSPLSVPAFLIPQDGASLTPYPALVWTTWIYGGFSHCPSPIIKLPLSKTSPSHTQSQHPTQPCKATTPIWNNQNTKTQPLEQSSVTLLTFQEAHLGAETPPQVLIHMEQPHLWQHCSSMRSCLRKPGPADMACAARVRLEINLCPLRSTGTAQAAALSRKLQEKLHPREVSERREYK